MPAGLDPSRRPRRCCRVTAPAARLELLVHAQPGTPLAETLNAVARLSPYDPERMRVEAAVMTWWAGRLNERAAVLEHTHDVEKAARERRAATRALKQRRDEAVSPVPDQELAR